MEGNGARSVRSVRAHPVEQTQSSAGDPAVKRFAMSIVAWIVLGLASGFIGSKLVGGSHGIVTDIIVGIIGAFVGGYVFRFFGSSGVTGFNLWSLAVAVVGSAVFLTLLYAIQRRI